MFSIQHTLLEKAQNVFKKKNSLKKSLQKCWKFQFHLLKSYIIDQEQSNAHPDKTRCPTAKLFHWDFMFLDVHRSHISSIISATSSSSQIHHLMPRHVLKFKLSFCVTSVPGSAKEHMFPHPRMVMMVEVG